MEQAYLPAWMCENLLLQDGGTVKLTLRTLPKVTFVKFQVSDATLFCFVLFRV
jgi:hypothetical protein